MNFKQGLWKLVGRLGRSTHSFWLAKEIILCHLVTKGNKLIKLIKIHKLFKNGNVTVCCQFIIIKTIAWSQKNSPLSNAILPHCDSELLFNEFFTRNSCVKGQLISKGNLVSSILPKMNLKMLIFALAYWGRNFLFVFLGELKKPKSPFEINWPLQHGTTLTMQVVHILQGHWTNFRKTRPPCQHKI